MGIYINMEMPTKGEYHMTLYVCGDGVAYVDVAELPADEDRFDAVPVPPHGRLIDADDFLNRAIGTRCFRVDYALMLEELVGESTTIIPAEEGE